MAIPTKIRQLARDIRTKIYGKDVRESIAEGMEESGDIADNARRTSEEAIHRVNVYKNQFDESIKNGDQPAEVQTLRVDPLTGETYATAADRFAANQRRIRTELGQITEYNFKDFYINDGSVALSQIINQAVEAGEAQVDIFVPKGRYNFISPFVNNENISIYINGKSRRHTVFNVDIEGDTFILNNAEQDLIIDDVQITGYQETDENYFKPGSIGIKTKGILLMDDVLLQGFEDLIEWAGGYYHYFKNCRFEKASKVVANGNVNNIKFDNCRVLRIDYFFEASSGAGPLVVTNSSFESWTTALVRAIDGNRGMVSMTGCYIENYPEVAAGRGLLKSHYSGAVVGTGMGAYTFLGNYISTRGIFRIVNNSGIDTDSLVSIGNTISYSSDTKIFYYYHNLKNGMFNDYAQPIGSVPDKPMYVAGPIANRENVKIFNPISGKDESPRNIVSRTMPGFTINPHSSYVFRINDLNVKKDDAVTVTVDSMQFARWIYQVTSVDDGSVEITCVNVGPATLVFNSILWRLNIRS